MAETSKIEWTDATWNPITGCSVVSPGCTNCYAMRLAGTRMQHHPSRAGLTTPSKAGPVWNGQVRLNSDWLDLPLHWKRPRRIFVCAHGDLFHESVPDEWIDGVFAVMALAQHHTFQVLTKRAARMRDYFARIAAAQASDGDADPAICPRLYDALACEVAGSPCAILDETPWPLPNVWLGVSAEDQARLDERWPDLALTPAARRFLSLEPLLGPMDITSALAAVRGRLHWAIAGGESGPGARPMHPDWPRQIRDDCAAAGVPFFFKQWGEWAPDNCQPPVWKHLEVLVRSWDGERWLIVDPGHWPNDENLLFRLGKKIAGRELDGAFHNAMPEAS